jgi:hypothetical protein
MDGVGCAYLAGFGENRGTGVWCKKSVAVGAGNRLCETPKNEAERRLSGRWKRQLSEAIKNKNAETSNARDGRATRAGKDGGKAERRTWVGGDVVCGWRVVVVRRLVGGGAA